MQKNIDLWNRVNYEDLEQAVDILIKFVLGLLIDDKEEDDAED